MEYFSVPFRIDSCERSVLWLGNEIDRVQLDPDGLVASFDSEDSARGFAATNSPSIPAESASALDLTWINRTNFEFCDIDCVSALNAWNFFPTSRPLLTTNQSSSSLWMKSGTKHMKTFLGQ
jgi:hypothetical protein